MAAHTCFVIAPIGAAASDTRLRSDEVFRHIIGPPVTNLGLEAVRGDLIGRSGSILGQVVRYIQDSPVMVADLTGYNPNVMYELAIAHADRKPVIMVRDDHEDPKPLPFDIGTERVIGFDLRLSDRRESACHALEAQLQEALQEPDCSSPVLEGIDLAALLDGRHVERVLGTVLSRVNDLHVRLIAAESQPAELLFVIGRHISKFEETVTEIERLADKRRSKELKAATQQLREQLDALAAATRHQPGGRIATAKRALARHYLHVPPPIRGQAQRIMYRGIDRALEALQRSAVEDEGQVPAAA
ncbi:MAG TPA: hypothetical protein VLG28_10100 [Acidimicrobiia bacterium]|nr:hypothetical protein [Acidimicrobiia bacterium]